MDLARKVWRKSLCDQIMKSDGGAVGLTKKMDGGQARSGQDDG